MKSSSVGWIEQTAARSKDVKKEKCN